MPKLNSPLLEFTMTLGLSCWNSTDLVRDKLLRQQSAQLHSQEWVGLYRNMEDILSEWVVSADYLKEFSSGHVQFNAEFMSTFPKSTVGSQYFTLT